MTTNEPMTKERLDAIQGRADRATCGPWCHWCHWCREDMPTAAKVIPESDDARFIAHAREDIPALLAEVERLRALTTVTDEMIERGARALYERPTPALDLSQRTSWDRVVTLSPFYTAEAYRNHARAVLAAALGTEEEA